MLLSSFVCYNFTPECVDSTQCHEDNFDLHLRQDCIPIISNRRKISWMEGRLLNRKDFQIVRTDYQVGAVTLRHQSVNHLQSMYVPYWTCTSVWSSIL